jgi:hypothetical protein
MYNFYSEMKTVFYPKKNIELLVEKFNRQTLVKEEWTHDLHLLVGIWYVKNFDFFDAVCRLKSGIILLNNSHKNENTGNSGYHETLTVFWASVIFYYIELKEENSDIEEIVNGFLQSPLADKNLPFEFYTRENLLSGEYRALYREGDKKLLNRQVIQLFLS